MCTDIYSDTKYDTKSQIILQKWIGSTKMRTISQQQSRNNDIFRKKLRMVQNVYHKQKKMISIKFIITVKSSNKTILKLALLHFLNLSIYLFEVNIIDPEGARWWLESLPLMSI